ncbi:amino acid adenylation domain-containing protein [Streptomyces sp. FL07-04A]|uniref:non-ribosomal peptide synthetase n=1 Tax=Streptomyces sp. FL07-04A TaxID=3028658 RepID=UPI0029B2DBDA|nr:amino acid adenylation domain-containing protein [Streptomyces sp. FL07-04A]MDX3578125.1 amino acid adenylation domain-containing protein [Streptomyces sp. FL07-04A]
MTTSTTELLQRLAGSGIRIRAQGDKLSVSGPAHALTDEVKQELRDRKQDIVRFFRQAQDAEAGRSLGLVRADRDGRLPASRAQQQLWLSEHLATDLPLYNMYFAVQWHGDLDVAAFHAAVDDLVRRHEILRTALTESDSGLLQTIASKCPTAFHLHEADPHGVEDLVRSLVSTRFDLSKAPLSRFDLICTGARTWVFLVVQHHVISDGWSTDILRRELAELYCARVEKRAPVLAEPTVQYADYACWEETWLAGEHAERQRHYWRRTLADLPTPVDLVPGRRRETVPGYRADGLEFDYDAAFLTKVHALCAETGSTLYGTLLAAYSLLLSRMARTDDVVVGSPLANRPHPELENTPGLFFNSISLRTRVDETQSVRDFLATTRKTAYEAFAHQELPFDQVVQATAPQRSGAHAPVFQTVFLFQTFPESQFELPGVEAAPYPVPTYSSQYDLMFRLREVDGELRGLLTYSTTQLDEDDAVRLVTAYRRLVERMCEDPDAPLARLGLMDEDSAERIARWNAETASPVPSRPVYEDILARLEHEPDLPALRFRGTCRTRGEVARGARAVAAGLRARGLRPGQRVGVLMARSPELVMALVGIMSAGLVYVPLDGTAPDSRLQSMTETADCAALVVDDAYRERCPAEHRLRLNALELLAAPDGPAPRQGARESAYVIFTSGSTGVPKGVEITHAGLANLFVALDEAVRPGEGTVWLSVTAATFDIAVVELLWTLARGIPVVMAENLETLRQGAQNASGGAPVSIPELILESGATAMQATPTLVRTVLGLPRAEEALGALSTLMVGGEPLDLTLARRLKALGIPRVLNMYGPTETTVWSTCWEVPADPDRVLIGRPLANTSVHIVDERLNPVPVGMYGELVIAGAGVARGYVGNKELTERRFPSSPSFAAGGPVYRTGDMARLRPDGTLELVGRMDNQVKLHGYRIELEDIEQAVNTVPGVAQCAVVLQQDGERQALVAHYVPAAGASLEETRLRGAVEERLPAPMVPSVFVARAALPTTSSGKTDRKALPRVTLHRSAHASAEPAHDLERRLLAVWRTVLGDDGIGPLDDFFQVGGSSVLVPRLLAEVRRLVHPQAQIVDFFRCPSVRAYAAHIDRTSGSTTNGQERTGPRGSATGQAEGGTRRQRMQQLARRRRADALGLSDADVAD